MFWTTDSHHVKRHLVALVEEDRLQITATWVLDKMMQIIKAKTTIPLPTVAATHPVALEPIATDLEVVDTVLEVEASDIVEACMIEIPETCGIPEIFLAHHALETGCEGAPAENGVSPP